MLQSTMPVATHEISLHGVSGAIFWLILAALIFYILGFATVGWEKVGSYGWIGLWQTCASGDQHHYNEYGMILHQITLYIRIPACVYYTLEMGLLILFISDSI